MRDFLLDTQMISYWFDDQSEFHERVRDAAAAIDANSHVCVSAITLGEIEYGRVVSGRVFSGRHNEYACFVREKLPRIVTVSQHTAEPYGRVRATLFEKFAPRAKRAKKRRAEELVDPSTGKELGIDENDLWLVAQALERNLVLVSNDRMTRITFAVREFHPDFSFENWASG